MWIVYIFNPFLLILALQSDFLHSPCQWYRKINMGLGFGLLHWKWLIVAL